MLIQEASASSSLAMGGMADMGYRREIVWFPAARRASAKTGDSSGSALSSMGVVMLLACCQPKLLMVNSVCLASASFEDPSSYFDDAAEKAYLSCDMLQDVMPHSWW